MMPTVSVVLPTYNRLARLKTVLKGLEQQNYALQDFEVIVVSDGSTDGTEDYIRTVETPLDLRSFSQHNQGAAVARNFGLEKARGAIILFIDDDVVPAPQLIVEHMRIHQQDDGRTVVLGPMLTPPDYDMLPWVAWEQAMLEKQYKSMVAGDWQPTARQFYTGNTSLARQHLLDHEGFDPCFRRAEDVELAYRLADSGLRFQFNPEAVGYHYAERSFVSWERIPYEYGRNDVRFHVDKGQDWLLPTVYREYQGRNPMIRGLALVCLDRSTVSKISRLGLKWIAALGARAQVAALPKIAYSGIFNLQYYQGIADQLGGRKLFFAGLKAVPAAT